MEAAKDCGVNAVKFQSWTPTSLYSEQYLKDNPELYKALAETYLSIAALKKLKLVAKKLELDFICSVFSEDEVDALYKEVDFIKVASMDANNLPLLKHIASKRKPTILSLGMAAPDEARTAIDILRKTPLLTVMHCVSLYPCPLAKANLNKIDYLRRLLGDQAIKTGYSDHTLGNIAAIVAASKGAHMIEKHFTLDKNAEGMDHAHSADPEEMKALVKSIREVEIALQRSELEDAGNRDAMRRSLVASSALKAGRRLRDADIARKRPGTGFAPSCDIVGRIVNKDLPKGHIFQKEDLE